MQSYWRSYEGVITYKVNSREHVYISTIIFVAADKSAVQTLHLDNLFPNYAPHDPSNSICQNSRRKVNQTRWTLNCLVEYPKHFCNGKVPYASSLVPLPWISSIKLQIILVKAQQSSQLNPAQYTPWTSYRYWPFWQSFWDKQLRLSKQKQSDELSTKELSTV